MTGSVTLLADVLTHAAHALHPVDSLPTVTPLPTVGAGASWPAGAGTDLPAVGPVFRYFDLVGVFANATMGSVIARHERLDPVGFATLAILSGLGGGIIRDLLLAHGPPAALTDYAYVLTALAAATLVFGIRVRGRLWERVWPVIDGIALGSWAAAGALKTLSVGLGWLPAILLGTITAVGGGALRDIVLRRTPAVLGGNTLYATCAIAAAAVMVGAHALGYPDAGLVVATIVGAGLFLLARHYGWMLPDGDSWAPHHVVPRSARRAVRGHARALAHHLARRRAAGPSEKVRRRPTTDPDRSDEPR